MKTNHTPGPWELRHERNGKRTDHVIKMGTAACYFNRGVGQTDIEAEANAQLIATAPDLYNALNTSLKLGEKLLAQRDEAHKVIEQFGRTVTDMFEQMERGHWTDDHGHDVTLNAAMIALKQPVLDAIALRALL